MAATTTVLEFPNSQPSTSTTNVPHLLQLYTQAAQSFIQFPLDAGGGNITEGNRLYLEVEKSRKTLDEALRSYRRTYGAGSVEQENWYKGLDQLGCQVLEQRRKFITKHQDKMYD